MRGIYKIFFYHLLGVLLTLCSSNLYAQISSGHTVVTDNSVKFYVNNAAWADIHYTVNNGGQQNIRLAHNADNTNTFTLSAIPAGATVRYNFTVGALTGGASDTAWAQFNCCSGGTSSIPASSVPKSSTPASSTPANNSSVTNVGSGHTVATGNSVKFYVNNAAWADIHYTINGGAQQNIRLAHNADNTNTFTLSALPAGATIRYNFTVGGLTGGASDTAWVQFNCCSGDTSSTGASSTPKSSTPASSTPSGGPAGYTLCAAENGTCSFSGAASVAYGANGIFNYVTATNTVACNNATFKDPIWGVVKSCYYKLNVLSSTPASSTPKSSTPKSSTPSGGPAGYSLCATENGTCSFNGAASIAYGANGVFNYLTRTNIVACNNATFGDPIWGVVKSCYYKLNASSLNALSSSSTSSIALGAIVPLFNNTTLLEPVIQFDRGDALVTRISDRGRDRHAKESQFQAYDHFLSFYWEHRTATIEIIDYVAKGGSSIRMNVTTQFRLNDTEAENRWFYRGVGTVAEYHDNGTMNIIDDLHYYKERSFNAREGRNIQIGDKLEFEMSQFLDHGVPHGRSAYYGTTYLYIVGEGLVPWDVTGAFGNLGGVKDSIKIPEKAWLGGKTTLPYSHSNEPDNHFIQMATNLGYGNGQAFVLGRRVHHASFVDGSHDENVVDNGIFPDTVGKAGPHFVNDRCVSCHVRNGRAAAAPIGQPLEKWVFKVADANGNPHPSLGRALQAKTTGSATSEGQASIQFWTEANGLRKPNYQFTGITPPRFSARVAPQLVGMGLLEAIPESTVLAKEDPNDSNGDGISGKANRIADPTTGATRLGRFGYKAGTTSVKHQVASAFNLDMGVMTSVFPTPDCGSSQNDCGGSGSELSDVHLNNLVKYVSTLGVRPQRNLNDATVQNGEVQFANLGCVACHTPSVTTSQHHPLGELRSQTIHPYTDLLLHDMGADLADNLGEGQATGAEWRTAPLWGLGLSACVTGGVTNAAQGAQVCTPVHSYLHDGRARSIEEAILWHGGEGQASKTRYQALSSSQKQDVLKFLESL